MAPELWNMVLDSQHLPPEELAESILGEASRGNLDFRTRLLIRDALAALERHWGAERLQAWLAQTPLRTRLEDIRREDLGEVAYGSLPGRIMEPTSPETVRQYLRELGLQLPRGRSVAMGGSVSLILAGHLTRRTEDIDLVDEVPEEIRASRALLDRLEQRYGLKLTHFQSHYLPHGWEDRLHSAGSFGRLEVSLVDPADVFLSKLFSRREKDRDDLRVLAPALDKAILEQRLKESCGSLLSEGRQAAADNWYILYGEPLP